MPSSSEALTLVTLESSTRAVLKQTAQAVTFPLIESDKNLITAMKSLLFELGGVGLAAPQVDKNRAIIAVYIPEDAASIRDDATPYPMRILLNPRYEAVHPKETARDIEGCYSVTHKAGEVPRYKSIKLTFYDEQGNKHTSTENGFYARVLQHEIDHLNGILIVDRITPDCVQGTREEMQAYHREHLPPEKRKLYDEMVNKKLATISQSGQTGNDPS